jgi:hypothetical protein
VPARYDPADLPGAIEYLEGQTDARFQQSLADCIMDPDDLEQAAFRSEQLAFRSLAAAKTLIEQTNRLLVRKQGESTKGWQVRTEHFRTRVGMERRILQTITDGIRARDGFVASAPNPVQRAMRRLAQLNRAGDVPKGTIYRLVEEERQKDADQLAKRKAERAEARRAAKRAQPEG